MFHSDFAVGDVYTLKFSMLIHSPSNAFIANVKCTNLISVEALAQTLLGQLSFEYKPKGGGALRLGSKGRYGSCVGGR